MSWVGRLRTRREDGLYRPPRRRSSYRVGAWLFGRLLAAVYLIAFLSIWAQAEGLYGKRGILPVAKYLEVVESQLPGDERLLRVPSLFWLGAGDGALDLVCAAGVVLSLVALAGWLAPAAFAGLWLLYLSLVAVGQEFLSFQWDVLLLEAGLLAVFLAASGRWRRGAPPPPPSRVALWLLWWLFFRLMFGSGLVKLTSGDPTWTDLTALFHHYQTQPLPNPFSWWAHHLPPLFHRLSTAAMFAVELGAPLLILLGWRGRRIAAAATVAFQLVIALTGNYTFFNLLTIVLCVPLLDDALWAGLGLRVTSEAQAPPARWSLLEWGAMPLAVLVLVVSSLHLWAAFHPRAVWPEPARSLVRTVAPFRSINSYGLFRVMTTRRPEIEVEGRREGGEWKVYRFRYKPGPLDRRPPVVAPHQPRLDWQLWFAALAGPRQSDWFFFFLARLAQGSPEVLALLDGDPFEGKPPDTLRARLWGYRFTTPEERRETGDWWRREFLGVYLPATPADRLARLFPVAP